MVAQLGDFRERVNSSVKQLNSGIRSVLIRATMGTSFVAIEAAKDPPTDSEDSARCGILPGFRGVRD